MPMARPSSHTDSRISSPSAALGGTYRIRIKGEWQSNAALYILDNPDFDPNFKAVYYVRVLEIPTPRWTAYDAVRYNITMPQNVAVIHQERAFTSPIWYTPN